MGTLEHNEDSPNAVKESAMQKFTRLKPHSDKDTRKQQQMLREENTQDGEDIPEMHLPTDYEIQDAHEKIASVDIAVCKIDYTMEKGQSRPLDKGLAKFYASKVKKSGKMTFPARVLLLNNGGMLTQFLILT